MSIFTCSVTKMIKLQYLCFQQLDQRMRPNTTRNKFKNSTCLSSFFQKSHLEDIITVKKKIISKILPRKRQFFSIKKIVKDLKVKELTSFTFAA